jgi:hypothetical protein
VGGDGVSCEHDFELLYYDDVDGAYVGFECKNCGMVVVCDVESPYENAKKGRGIIRKGVEVTE